MSADRPVPTQAPRARREPWPWILAGLLTAMIGSSLLLLAIAIRYADVPIATEEGSGRIRAEALEAPGTLAGTPEGVR